MHPWNRFTALFRKQKLNAEMSEEMRGHLELQAAENERRGMDASEARYAAQRAFGGLEQIKERARDARGGRGWEQACRDFSFARRSLLRSPGFAGIALVTIALGIGVNTGMFSLLNGLLLRPLSFPDRAQLFFLERATPQSPRGGHSLADYGDLAREASGFATLAGFRFWSFNISEPGRPADSPNAMRVTANFLDVLGLRPMLGRGFLREEDTPGRNNVVVLGHHYWQSRYGGDPGVIGRTIRLDGAPVEIIGVLPESFDRDATRLWVPLGLLRPYAPNERERADRRDHGFTVIGRFANGATAEDTRTRWSTLAQQLARDFPLENGGAEFVPRSLQSSTLTGSWLRITWLLIGLSGAVLVIACANLANLLLARALARGREFAIRAALGASRAQLVRPLLAECVLLAGAGAVFAVVLAQWIGAWIAHEVGGGDGLLDFSIDARVTLFMLGAGTLTVVLFGVGPAWWVSRIRPGEALKSGARGSSDSRAQQRYRHGLIGAQFALALVLLAGAAFFLRGVQRLTRVDQGWEPDALISASMNSPIHYSETDRLIAWQEELRARLRAIPGVASVATCFQTPLFPPPVQRGFIVEGRDPPPAGKEPLAHVNAVSADYLATVGLTRVRGRFFDATDQRTSPAVVVVNETMARTLFPGEDPIGRRLGVRGREATTWAEIVGVVADTRPMSVAPPAVTFQVYKPYAQEAWQFVTIAVRASSPGAAASLLNPIRQAVAALDPDLPLLNLRTVPEAIQRSATNWRLVNRLLLMFAALGLFLAAFGIYGVIARLVAQRTNEFGIRLALGAKGRDIMSLVLGRGVRPVLWGGAAGLLCAVGLTRFLTHELPGFGSDGFLPLAAVTALLLGVALIACVLPARRATKVDPMCALRAE